MKVNGKDDIPYMKSKIKAMFETTNQIFFRTIFSFMESLVNHRITAPAIHGKDVFFASTSLALAPRCPFITTQLAQLPSGNST